MRSLRFLRIGRGMHQHWTMGQNVNWMLNIFSASSSALPNDFNSFCHCFDWNLQHSASRMYSWRGSTVHFRCPTDWRIQSFPTELHQIRDISVGSSDDVLVKFRSIRVRIHSKHILFSFDTDYSSLTPKKSIITFQWMNFTNFSNMFIW